MSRDDDRITSDFYDEHLKDDDERVIDPKKEREKLIADMSQDQQSMDESEIVLGELTGTDFLDKICSDLKIVPTDKKTLAEIHQLINTNHIYSGFNPEIDKFKSVYYLHDVRKKMLGLGFPEGSALDDFLFNVTTLRRFQMLYQQSHYSKVVRKIAQPEDFSLLEQIKKLSKTVQDGYKGLVVAREALRSGQDVHDLHKRELDDNAKFIKDHVGEFIFRCSHCDTVVSAGGLPHWAYEMKRGDKGEPLYHIWNREIFYLVRRGVIPMHYMAFFLHTSIEGLEYTAGLRGEKFPTYDIKKEEKLLKEMNIKFEELDGRT